MTRFRQALIIASGCILGVVVMVRAQEGATEPGLFPIPDRPAADSGQPTLAVPPATIARPQGEPTPALRASAFDTPTSESDTSGAPVRRPSSAERLKQLRESTNRPGSPASPSRAVVGPVKSSPVDLGRQSTGKSTEPLPVEPAPHTARLEKRNDDGTTSVLKRPEDGSPNDRATARRLLRAPVRNSEPATLLPTERVTESVSDSSQPTAAPTGTTAPTTQSSRPAARDSVLQESAPRSAAPREMEGTAARPVKSAALLSSHGPNLQLETTGPSSVIVGKEATYIVTLQNAGNAPATGIQLRVGLPSFVRAVAEGSTAEKGVANDPQQAQRFVWSIAQIPARGSERVTIRVIPTENKPIELFVDWTTRPTSVHTQIEVLQPQLELAVFGPRNIQYGETAVYTIRLSNPGTGEATDVAVEFGYADQRLEPKRMGTLAPGQQTELKVELNAREAGTMEVVAAATASGGLQVNARHEVLVRRAKLEVDVEGDPVAFAGSPASYRVKIHNAGDAPATDVQAILKLPSGAKLLSGDGLKQTGEGLVVNVGNLPPQADRSLAVQCQLLTPGDNQIAVRALGAGDQESSDVFVTRVEVLADLKLVINDPQGPVALNKEAVYELHIVNRGSKAATKVSIVAQFSPGIEPISAAGSGAQVVPGQVIFDTIPRIEPGQELTLVVKARAESEGNKRFRAEVTAEESDTQLVAQETTYFYRDGKGK